MKATISTHNGKEVHQKHNMRDKDAIKNQDHIDINGIHENWINRNIREEYKKIFGDAVERYNKKQKRKDRKIEDYYSKVKKNKQKQTAYEMIICIGNVNQKIPDEVGKEIMKEFCKTWSKRNPNFHLLGCYYHADEVGVPHVHIDYICVGHGFKKSLDTQVSQERALNEMGYFSEKKGQTAQMKWTKAQNEYLKELCEERGITVIRLNEKRKHLETQLYKEKQELLGDYEFELEQEYNQKYQELERDFDERYEYLDDMVEEEYRKRNSYRYGSLDDIIEQTKKDTEIQNELFILRKLKQFCEKRTVSKKPIIEYFNDYYYKERQRDDDDFER